MAFVSVNAWPLIVCDTGIYAIINNSIACARECVIMHSQKQVCRRYEYAQSHGHDGITIKDVYF